MFNIDGNNSQHDEHNRFDPFDENHLITDAVDQFNTNQPFS